MINKKYRNKPINFIKRKNWKDQRNFQKTAQKLGPPKISTKFKRYRLNSTYYLGAFCANMTLAMRRKMRFTKIIKTNLAIRLLRILYVRGVIRTFHIQNDIILVYFKYLDGQTFCTKLTLISKPSRKAYMCLSQLAKTYNSREYTVFYIVSTNQGGFVSSDFCLLHGHSGGRLLIKVELGL